MLYGAHASTISSDSSTCFTSAGIQLKWRGYFGFISDSTLFPPATNCFSTRFTVAHGIRSLSLTCVTVRICRRKLLIDPYAAITILHRSRSSSRWCSLFSTPLASRYRYGGLRGGLAANYGVLLSSR